MNYIEIFKQTVAVGADRTALVDHNGERSVSYAELDRMSGLAAGKLRRLGCRPGSFVIVCMERRAEYMAACLGAIKAGCVFVPLVPSYPEERIRYIREDCSAVLTVDGSFFDGIEAESVLEEPAEDAAPVLLAYTSGSTGTPKGILFSAGDLARSALRHRKLFEGISPLIHGATAQFSFLAHLLEYYTVFSMGGTVHILPDEARKSAAEMARYFERHGVTVSWIVPQMLRVFRSVYTGAGCFRRVLSGGERMSRIAPEGFEVYNVYGMSESAAIATMYPVDRMYDNTPIGKALEPLEVILCKAGEQQPSEDGEGEICMIGEFDTVYFKDPERTARTMLRLPDGRVMIRTGDIGRLVENGDLIYVNRADWMVKINGQRVETSGVEAVLTQIPGVANAAVKAFEDDAGQTYLAAYYISAQPMEPELRAGLKKKLPDYMIPRFFVRMEAFPLNANGKLNRLALTPPDAAQYKTAYTAPENDFERALCAGFEEILGCGRVGTSDDFFALGGDSIKVLRLMEAVGGLGLTPDQVLTGRTPKAIAALCGTVGGRLKHSETVPECCPLSEAQKGVYLECLDDPSTVMYNIPMLLRLPDDTDPARLIAAVRETAAQHPALFVTVRTPGGVPSMIYRAGEVTVIEKTTDSLPRECRDFVRPFDLENGPLYRFELCRSPEGLALLTDVHHLVFDGTSAEALASQIAERYNGGGLHPEALTVFDVALADQQMTDTDACRAAREFFRSKLEGTDCDSRLIPDQVAENAAADARPAASARIVLTADDRFGSGEVTAFTKAHRITENTLFLSAFAYALAKFNGTDESSFCTVNNGRHEPGLAGSVGMFVRTLPVYCNFDENTAVADFLPRMQEDFFTAMRHDVMPFGELAAQYGVNTGVVFVYQAELFGGAALGSGRMTLELLDAGEGQSDLDVMLIRTDTGYELMAHYRTALYSEALIRSFAATYLNVIRAMLTAETLGDIVLTDAAQRAVLDGFNQTEAAYDAQKTVVDLFREQAKKTPDNLCVVCSDRRYTYREIDELTDVLAQHLVRCGVGREKIVGVLIPRCEYMAICSLGVLKAGGAYLPLDPTYPPERLNLMVQDSGAMVLIFAPELADVITEEFTGTRLCTDEIPKLRPCGEKLTDPRPEDLFVMLYTSGSTGLPKGVMFQHSNTMVTTEWVKKYFEMDSSSRVTAYASYGFDAHAFDLYPAITSGAQLHIIYEDIRLDFPALKDYFNENGITHTVMTTQVGRQFALMGGLKTLRHLSVAGEKLTPPDVPEGFALYNLYGPTEGSIITSAFRIDRRYKDVPIGRPVENLKLYVVDKNRRLLPAGAVGELWIAGPHVTRGYRNRPEKTAEAYGENPFSTDPAYGRVYRTGDIVRLLSDGNLQFVGRRDAQVKVRGFRVELTEIEEVIRRFPGIQDATVAAFDDPAGGKFVAAYVVSDQTVSVEALADFIRAEKPPYMVPAVTMQIDAIPLNQNQKVNKRALPVPKRSVGAIVPPQNAVQQKIFDVIAEVIGHREFGIHTDIYEAGLTSIGAVRLNVLLAEAFDVPLRTADIKTHETVGKLEEFLGAAAPQTSYELRADYPITQTQSGIFVECMAAPDTTVYNIPVLIRLGGGVKTDRLVAALKAVLDAHPYLKTTLFTDAGGNVRAARHDDAETEISVIRCGVLPTREALVRPFTLLNAPLYHIAVYETEDGRYLFMDFHHIICDGTSESVLIRDISRAYDGETLTKETFSGFEAALEEEAVRSGEIYERAKAYWKGLLSGCEAASVPQKVPGCHESGAGYVKTAGHTDAAVVRAFCERNGLTLNAFFNAAFAFTLGRFCNQESVVYTTVYNGRNDSRLAEAVSMLVRTLPVTAELKPDGTVLELVRTMQQQLVNSMANDACSFAELASAYDVKADVMFIYQGDDFRFDRLCGEPAQMMDYVPETAKAPIAVNVYRTDDGYEYTMEYRRDTYGEPFAASLLDALDAVVGAMTAQTQLRELSMMSPRSEAVYTKMNDYTVPVTHDHVIRMFEHWAQTAPDAPALTSAGRSMTYGELNRSVNRMANALIRRGVGRESIVGLVLERGCEIPMAQLAVMKAGGAFAAALPSYPDDRIEYCLTDADSPCVITTEDIRSARPELFADGKPYRTYTVEELLAEENDRNPGVEILGSQLAYCIYTSGSTGKPKGVMIEHRNLVNTIETHLQLEPYFLKDEPLAALASCSVSFDASVIEIFMPLCSGKHLVMSTDSEHMNPLEMKKLMLEQHVEAMVGTPSYLSNLAGMPEMEPAFAQIKCMIVGAEAFPASLYEALRRCSPDMLLINGYGPSECTVCCSYKALQSAERITIGGPTGNVQLFVADKYGNVLPPYAVGELIICGAGVGRGYIKLPERTAASFFTFRGLPAYHSGDLVRLTEYGEIEFGGRMDNQVKLRGFRVELDEIENVMCSYTAVKQSKVVVRNNGSEDYLVGYYTADAPVDPETLTAYLKTRLTYYMVPAALMQLDQMPLTQNGKIDKKALPEVQKQSAGRSGRRAPKQSLEQRLCELFRSVLNAEEVFADDNFFEIGGTSLSASKITMMLMSDGIEVKYGDIFDHPTPELLAEFLEQRGRAAQPAAAVSSGTAGMPQRETLRHNMVKYAHEVRRESLGNVLLTGAAGFLGIHILNELLTLETGHVYCLMRRGEHANAEIRLKTMLVYYFSNGFEEALRDRITVIEADITDDTLEKALADVPFDTVINCAACVKHFSDSDILERINVHGVENLIGICRKRNARLVQISTVSVPGIHTPESYEKQIRMHENELFVIDDMNNKYAISKYHAELRMLDAIDNGLRGKIIRVGNLMGRHSDGEFQANMETNMFISGIRGFAVMGKYPISHMTDPMRFSPVDCTARAVVLLAGTNDHFTAFNCDNRYGFDEMKIIDACNRNGIVITPEADEVYYAEFQKKLGDDRINGRLNGLAAYDIKDAHTVDTDNLFTTNILYRIGFSWPLVDDSYLDRAINSIMTLDYFSEDDPEDTKA